VKVCQIGDGNSVHILRMAKWFREHEHIPQMISLTPSRERSDTQFDDWRYVHGRPGPGGFISKIIPIRRHIKELAPDVIHGHYMTSGGFFGRWSGHDVIVTNCWGSDIFQDCKVFSKRLLVKSAIKGSDVVMGDSDDMLNKVKSYYPKTRTHKFYIGVDTKIFLPMPSLKPSVFTFLSGRSSYPLYNPIRILRAFELLDGNSRLLLQRSRNPYPELEKLVEQSPARDRIEWYPVRDHSEMPALYNKAHVTVSIPDSDSSSAVMLESMGCAVPVIASKIPANDEWDGLGIYVPEDDSVEALANLMRKVMEHPELVKAYGNFARDVIIDRADWDKQMQSVVEVYEELLG